MNPNGPATTDSRQIAPPNASNLEHDRCARSEEDLLQQITWLTMELRQFQEEKAQFGSDGPLYAGTGFIGEVVPPLAGARLRSTVSSPSLGGYLFVADACYSVLTRLLKANSTVLDIGCGCGTQERNLLYHNYI
jgi:hypothetical protein